MSFDLNKSIHQEKKLLEKSQVPIVTVSGTFRKELLDLYHEASPIHAEALFSRAHYSMAEAVLQAASRAHKTAHLIDPTNFVDPNDWGKIKFTQSVGQQMARHQLLKWIKDKVDTIARSKLPITEAITPPLLFLTSTVKRPIISLHYEAGNILASHGLPIVQVLTDPHVRPQYLDPLPNSQNSTTISHDLSHIYYCVFDLQTKHELLYTATRLGKLLYPYQVIVTGPPVDPRLSKLAKNRPKISPHRPINVGITTGGLGTNLSEIRGVLDSFTTLLTPSPEHIRLFLYAGPHRDFRDFFEAFANEHNIRIGNIDDSNARIRILYEDSLIDANQNLIKYLFPWADVIITKPSGDMAYDAAAAGCVPLFLAPWGNWEENIQNRFVKLGVGFDLSVHKAHKHFTFLLTTNHLKLAQTKAINLPPLYRQGAKKIIALQLQLAKHHH